MNENTQTVDGVEDNERQEAEAECGQMSEYETPASWDGGGAPSADSGW